MNLISWIFLLLFFAAAGVGLLMALRAQKATVEASQAQARAEADVKVQREKLLEEAKREAQRLRERGEQEAEALRKESDLRAKEQALQARQEAEKLLAERQANLEKQEQRLQSKETGLQSKEEGLDKKLQQVELKAKDLETLAEKRKAELEKLETQQAEAKQLVEAQAKRLEEVAGLTREDAKKELISQLEYAARMDAAKLVRRIDEEAQEEAAKKARWTIGAAIQRVASDVVAEQSVSSVQLPSDDLKGRIIGREGRNIRALEKATGCDLIVDDTPESIVVSSFDPIRREVARQAILKLLADGRIHPARIEEVVEKVKVDMDQHLKEIGEAACIELGFPDVHPKLHKLVGRLNYRTSYGQNVLEHTKEVARIAEYMAGEMGADAAAGTTRRALPRHRQGHRPRGGGHPHRDRHAADAALRGKGGGHPCHELPPRGLRAPHGGGHAHHGRGRAFSRPPRRPPRDAGDLRQAPGEARGDRRQLQGRAEELRHAGGPRDPHPGGRWFRQRRPGLLDRQGRLTPHRSRDAVPRPDQGHGHAGVARGGNRTVGTGGL